MADLKHARLTHYPHPLITEGNQQFDLNFIEGETLASYLLRAGVVIMDDHPVIVYVNEERLLNNWQAYRLKSHDIINVRAAVQGKAGRILAAIAIVVLSAYTGGAAAGWATSAGWGKAAAGAFGAIVSATVTIAGTMLVNSMFPPPSAGKTPEIAEQERYVISGASNNQRRFEPMMFIIGKMRIYPDAATHFYTDFSGNEQFLYQAFHFGIQHNLTLTDVRIGSAEISNFNNITMEESGPDGRLSATFGNIDTIQGVEVKKSDGWVTRSTKAHTQSLELDFQVIAFDLNDAGAVTSQIILVDVEIYQVTSGRDLLLHRFTLTLHGNKISSSRTTHPVPLMVNDGSFLVKVRKTSDDIETTKKTRKLSWVSLKAFQKDEADYTGQKRMGITAKASGQFSGRLDQFNAICQSAIPTWTGSSWVTQFTSNPAWWLLWWFKGQRNRLGRRLYGAGLPENRIDLDSIKAFAVWCDRKNLECNAVINSSQSVKRVAEIITRCGRGQTTWQTGKYGVIWDDDQLSPVAVFGPANIKAGTFSIDYISGKLADEFIINFKNAANNWQADSVRATVGGIQNPDNPVEMDFIGCTDKDQAGKEASLLAASQQHFKRRTHWETDVEGLVASKGDVVLLSHDMVSWSHSGRLIDGGDHFNVYLDSDVPEPIGANAGVLGIRYPNGMYETYRVSAVDGNKIALSSGVTSTPDTLLPFESDSQACDFLWFYDPSATPGRKVKIIDVQASGSEGFTFSAIDYTQDYFDAESSNYIHHPGFSAINVDLGTTVSETVVGLNVIEGRRWTREHVRLPVASASWLRLLDADYYLFNYRLQDGGTWNEIKTGYQDLSFDVPKGVYEANVSAHLNDGRVTEPSSISFTIHDETYPATEVFGLKAGISNNGILISWDDCQDPDYVRTELRCGSTFATAQVLTEVKGNTFLSKWLPTGNHRFWARHWNPSLPSTTASSVNLNISPPADVKISRASMQVNALSLSWEDAKTSQPIKSYMLSIGSVNSDITTATFYGKAGADSRSDVVLFTSGGDFRVFMSAEDVAGNVSQIRNVDVTASLPANYAIAMNYNAVEGATLSNAAYVDGELFLPILTSETWGQHFSSRQWRTIQDQIDARFPVYFEPGAERAQLVGVKDVGKLLSSATISVRLAQSHSVGTVSATIKIEWSQDKVVWRTAPVGAIEVQASNIRYVRITVVAEGVGRDDLIIVTSVNVDIRVEDKTESGRVELGASDVNGTLFNPTKNWLDIVSAIVTPRNSPAITKTNVIIDDSGTYPTVRIMAWDEHSVRISGSVSILLGGY
ncbi:host specificity protein J [Photobacterium profundum]|uniref:Tip attachment protein J HDII-ins2 domain-containing protein n=1 Tax=Photobacterium profundum (strain SS9) TaxID=298386 RepID=Q6LHT5_PHOPR|nr:host specificity factor TipJ family phage tail protein [Photobacterium profundum]CAG23145.1 hypothetical protein PBPRB1274 [Photobacterium profundum SS9]